MRTFIALVWLTLIIRVPCLGAENNVFQMASPKLKHFLANHPAATQALAGTISESFSNRTVRLHYFYSNDESVSRASHHYPAPSVVGIVIRENQEPCDEYICLIFEILNSQGEQRFRELTDQARSGAVSKVEFVRGIMRQEFQAVKRVRGLLDSLKLSRKEKRASYYFKKFAECPDDFEAYVTYKPKGVSRNQVSEYEQLYESLRDTQ